jgi:hypothetical protein
VATIPDFLEPYQKVIPIADNANPVNGSGDWKCRNTPVKASANATDTNARPKSTAVDIPGHPIHFALSGLAIIVTDVLGPDKNENKTEDKIKNPCVT